MTLTRALIFAAAMLILFGGLFYTIRVSRWEMSEAAPLKARARPNARRDAERGGGN